MLVIFDCDGVLVDSEILSAQVFAECLDEKFGIKVSPYYSLETYRGKSVADCINMITDELTAKLHWQDLSEEDQQTLAKAGNDTNLMFAPSGVETEYDVNKILYKKKITFGLDFLL